MAGDNDVVSSVEKFNETGTESVVLIVELPRPMVGLASRTHLRKFREFALACLSAISRLRDAERNG